MKIVYNNRVGTPSIVIFILILTCCAGTNALGLYYMDDLYVAVGLFGMAGILGAFALIHFVSTINVKKVVVGRGSITIVRYFGRKSVYRVPNDIRRIVEVRPAVWVHLKGVQTSVKLNEAAKNQKEMERLIEGLGIYGKDAK